MSFLSNVEAIWQKDEAWVLGFVMQAKTEAEIVIKDLKQFWTWLAAHSQEISQDAASVTAAIATLKASGIVTVPSSVTDAVSAMNVAVAGLNGAVASAANGASGASVIVAAYNAAKQAQAAHADAAVAVVNAPIPAAK